MEKLIGQLCMAANKAGIELTAWELYRLANALESEFAADAKADIPPEIIAKEKAREPKIMVYEESIPMTDDMERLALELLKKMPVPAETPAPEQPKPKPVKEKASGTELPPRQQELWDYIQAHKDASLDEICAGMGISTANYYFLKRKLKDKGYIIPAATGASKNKKKHGRNILKNIGKIHQEENRDMNQRMEDAYLGEHPNIQPDPVPKQPVSKQARRLYEYMQSHPDSRMPKTCEDLGITTADYYMLKAALKRNGWIESAVENVQAY